MTTTLTWDADGLVLSLSIYVPGQPQHWPTVALATLEDVAGDGSEGWAVTVHQWGTWDADGESMPDLMARDGDEARRLVAAVLGVRGLSVPEWKQ